MIAAALLLVSCTRAPVPPEVAAPDNVSSALADFFDAVHADELADDPMRSAHLGVPHDDTTWTSYSYAHATARHERTRKWLAALQERFADADLDETDRLSYTLFERRQTSAIESFEWFYHGYRVNQMWGVHTRIPSFLMTVHRIDSAATAQSWIARVRGVPDLFEEVRTILDEQERRGILPPAFVYPHVLGAIDRLLTGAPFDDGPSSPLLAHFEGKLASLELDQATSDRLQGEATDALMTALGPAYRALADTLRAHEPTTDDGAWKLPDGDAYYAHRLRDYTTTERTPNEIHELGLAEVARIHGEMRSLMPAMGIDGDLPQLFEHLRGAEQYVLPNTDAGREQYLELARDYVAGMEERLPDVFDLLPDASLEVKRVEPWRENSAGKAFYQRAAPDGSRPGMFYANLRDMANMPLYQLEALVYHEGVPGHHMQGAVSMALGDLPPFRRFGGYTAYSEGWGLYSEMLPKEMGFYTDPASDVGRLAMELWRAARLVVDTGIHHRKWTREAAIDYLRTNTPNPEGDCIHAIERYIVAPGQATAYKIGMLEILALRQRARAALGDRFTLTDFHRVVLGNGPVPLDVLGERIDAWVASAQP